MSPTAYILRQPVQAKRPSRWDIHARYAMRLPDETLNIPAGTWLLALPEAEDACPEPGLKSRPHPPHYRLADGSVVCLDAPLTAVQADPLTNPQALTALTTYRPLEQAIAEDWGVQVEHVDHNAPFRLIQCPLCESATFVSVGFAGVWCDRCQAEFHVRHTAGDPGFVVDCTWAHYQPTAARYLLPRSDELLLTMVCKNGGGDPLDLTHSLHCFRDDCTDAQVALTDGRDGPLRAELHACVIGDVYDWSFYGRVPTIYNHDRHGHHTLLWPGGREESWPRSAFVPVNGFRWEDKQRATGAAALLASSTPAGYSPDFGSLRYRDELAAFLKEWAQRPSHPPAVGYRGVWPQRSQLQENERYLLHRWLLHKEKDDSWMQASPVWLVVTDEAQEKYDRRWRVVRDNICPHCGRPVSQAEWASRVNEKRPWDTPHGSCREFWARHNWQPGS